MSENIRSVVLAGVGGQGILLASEVVARTALVAGHRVKTNQVHGMAQRGGSVIAQIRYGAQVHSPLVEEGTASVLCALERIEAIRFAHYLAPGALAVVNSQSIVPVTVSTGAASYPDDAPQTLARLFARLVCFDATEVARRLGNVRAANIVLLGALSPELDLPREAWLAAIRQSVKPQFVDLNLAAFGKGIELRA